MAAHPDFEKIRQQCLNERKTNRNKLNALRAISSKLDALQKSVDQHIYKLANTKKTRIKDELTVLSGSVVVTLRKRLPFPRRPGVDIVTYRIDDVYVEASSYDNNDYNMKSILEREDIGHEYKSEHLQHLENEKLIPEAYDFMIKYAADCEYKKLKTKDYDADVVLTKYKGTWSGYLYAHTLASNSDRLCEIPEFGKHLFSKFEFEQVENRAPELFGTMEFAEQLTETCTKTVPKMIDQFKRTLVLSEFGFFVMAELCQPTILSPDCSIRYYKLDNVEVCAIPGSCAGNIDYKYNHADLASMETKIREAYGPAAAKMLWPSAQEFTEVYNDSTGSLYLHCCYGWPFGDKLGQEILDLFSRPLSLDSSNSADKY